MTPLRPTAAMSVTLVMDTEGMPRGSFDVGGFE
jgi:hypothetical protein